MRAFARHMVAPVVERSGIVTEWWRRVRNPLVSVLTPSFNQVQWIHDNLRSVAEQTHPRIEHIVADGGSTDGTIELLGREAGPRVDWQSHPDDGQSAAINEAFSRSHGEILGWLNSDDAYFSTDAVAAAVDAFSRNPGVDVVYGHAALVNADGLVLQVTWVPPMRRRLLRAHNFIIQPAAFIRRRAVEDQLVDPAYQSMMDRELWLRLSDRHRFARVNRILAIDRHQPHRKVISRPDLAARDRDRLAGARQLPSVRSSRAVVRAVRLGARFAGLAHLAELRGADLAFDGRVDGLLPLLARQIMLPRSWMPIGDADTALNPR